MRNRILFGLAALVSACCPTLGNGSAYPLGNKVGAPEVELKYSIDGADLPATTIVYDAVAAQSKGKCSTFQTLYTDPTNKTIQFSTLRTSCDTDNDGTADYFSVTRLGRGESEPFAERFVLPGADGRRTSPNCGYKTYEMDPSTGKRESANDVGTKRCTDLRF